MQGNFDCGLGAVIAVHADMHGGKRTGNVGGIAAAQCSAEIMDASNDALQRIAGHDRRRRRFTPADQAVIGFDPHQYIVGAPNFLARHDDGLEHRQADGDRLDGFDVHVRYQQSVVDNRAARPRGSGDPRAPISISFF